MTDTARIELLNSRLTRYLAEIEGWQEKGRPDADRVASMENKLKLVREELAELQHPKLALT